MGDEDEAFYLRVHGAGEYCYKGADMGILVTRGKMQTRDRELTDRARFWSKAIMEQFVSEPVEVTPPEIGVRKML